MTESEYIAALRRRWPREGQETSPETIALADEAAAQAYFDQAATLRKAQAR